MTKREKFKKFVKENQEDIIAIGVTLIGAGLCVKGLSMAYDKGYKKGFTSYGFPKAGDEEIVKVFASLEDKTDYIIYTGYKDIDKLTPDRLGELGDNMSKLGCDPDQGFDHFIAIGKSINN